MTAFDHKESGPIYRSSEFENKINMFFSGLHIYFLLGIIIMDFTNLAEAMGSASFDSPVPASMIK